MTRALSLSCLALFLIGITGSPAFAGKPMIAVLGLEVVDQSGTPTPADTQAAKELSDGLRSRAKAGTGPYQYAPGSDKELIDQKLLNNCDTEAPACMSAIGNQLGAEILMYGRLEKQGKAYQVTIKVLDVGRKNVLKTWSDLIPVNEASGALLQGWAKKIYAKLTGETVAAGGIVLKLSNAERGTILIDGEPKGTITNGTGQVSGLADGKYRVTVESDGFRRWEKEVTVSGGTATVPVEMERGDSGGGGGGGGGDIVGPGPGPGPGPGGGGEGGARGSTMWKGVFAASLLAAGGGGYLWFAGKKQIDESKDALCAGGAYSHIDSTCPTTGSFTAADVSRENDKGDSGKLKTYVGVAFVGIGVGFAAVALYKGFLEKKPSSSESQSARGKRQRRERFIVTPVVSPNGGGATLRLDW